MLAATAICILYTVSIFETGILWPNHYCTYHIVSMWLMACMCIYYVSYLCGDGNRNRLSINMKKALAGRLLAWLLNSTHFVNGIFSVHRLSGFRHAVVIHSDGDKVRFHASNSMRKPIFILRFLLTSIFGEIIMFEWSGPNGIGRFFPRISYDILAMVTQAHTHTNSSPFTIYFFPVHLQDNGDDGRGIMCLTCNAKWMFEW